MRYYLDGYNVLFQLAGDTDLQEGREWLIQKLTALSPNRRCTVVVVFDASLKKGEATRTQHGPIQVVYTAAGESADAYLLIELEHCKEQATLVTSDRLLRIQALELGRRVMEPAAFWRFFSKQVRSKDDFKPVVSDKADYERWLNEFSE